MATADGTEHEVPVSADDKANHASRMKAASVDCEAATHQVLSIAPTGTVLEIELDDKAGTVAWEAKAGESSDTEYDVLSDAGSRVLTQKKLNVRHSKTRPELLMVITFSRACAYWTGRNNRTYVPVTIAVM